MYKKINDYGIIGNLHTAALVGSDGSIDWMCLPHLDSPSVFAAILDDEKGGRFAITPAGGEGFGAGGVEFFQEGEVPGGRKRVHPLRHRARHTQGKPPAPPTRY